MGTECHTVFECLLAPKHKDIYDQIMTAPASVRNSPVVTRHIERYMKKTNLPDECFDKIDAMIVVGLGTDFFCKGGELLSPELEFTIENKKHKYLAGGKIDKAVKYKDKWIRIADYKSSTKKFKGEELTINIQAMMYSLAAKHLWPHLTPIVDFIFLQFPKDPYQRLKFSDEQLNGFEIFLAQVYAQMQNFTIANAKQNFAAKQKAPRDGGFKGPLLCGWSFKGGFVKSPDELKKDGSPKFYCPYRFPFVYYALCDNNDKVIRTSKENDLIANEAEGQYILKKKYEGCPSFSH